MSKHGTAIEWTHIPGFKGETWNPVGGCSHASTGCKHCYAERGSVRLPNHPVYDGTVKATKAGPKFTGKMTAAPLDHPVWTKPIRWREPRAIFVCSMSDLFHESRPFADIDRIFAVASVCYRHRFIVLTKRGDRMREYIESRGRPLEGGDLPIDDIWKIARELSTSDPLECWPFPNIWLGVSAENQETADERIPILLDTAAAVRFVSYEPALGPVDFEQICLVPKIPKSHRAGTHLNALSGRYAESGVSYIGDWDINEPYPTDRIRRRLDWIIAGGESGPKARPPHPDWFRSARAQCALHEVPFFFKQWGEWSEIIGIPRFNESVDSIVINRRPVPFKRFDDGAVTARLGKREGGRLLDGRTHSEFPRALR